MSRGGMALAVVVAVGSITGFAYWAGPGRAPSGCAQPPWHLSSSVVAQGGILTVGSDGATACDPGYGWNAGIVVTVSDAISGTVRTVEAPLTSDGAFSVEVPLPADVRPGSYGVLAQPRRGDACPDTGSCAAPTPLTLRVVPAG